METLLQLPGVSGVPIRVIQITDTHLFADKRGTLLGVNTYESYYTVLSEIKSRGGVLDIVVATGDLAQDQSAQAYQHFIDGVTTLAKPCVWLPGNHDFQPTMVDVLTYGVIAPQKQVLLGDNWQLLLLDSQVSGVPHGQLSDYQLTWLESALAHYPARYALILLHHHPVASGCVWLDKHNLRNAHLLAQVLANYPRAQTLVCGHIHQEMDVIWQGRRVLATPSTCVQFKPLCTNFTLDTLAPGWRYFDLYPDGTVVTEVCRVNSTVVTPDMEAQGY